MLASHAACAGLVALPLAPASGEEDAIGEFGFFDYLGAMVEQDGEWLDPMDMSPELDVEPGDDVTVEPPAADADAIADDAAQPEDKK
ncbi:MAG TPA: hypothetical protein PKK10_18350 [Woeseiaceae bacterium]|nr:hypothetical protein [Woeseiaceae bacterium]